MVNIMDAYSILNGSVLNVINDLVMVDATEFDNKSYQVRLDENLVSVAETHNRLEKTVVVAHNLSQYINKFYSIFLDSSETVPLDYLINVNPEDIDLTEFGEFL